MNNKLKLSEYALGLWRLTEAELSDEDLLELIKMALNNGITTFDHADIYGGGEAQIQFGRVLNANQEIRKQIQIISKCGIVRNKDDESGLTPSHYNTSYNHIMAQTKLILEQLQIDYLDMLLIHRVDHLMDFKEVARAFRDLKDQGLVNHFGVSNFLVPQLDALIKEFPEIELNQIQISVDHLEHFKNGVLERCAYHDCGVMAYSPLGGGLIFKDPYHNPLLKEEMLKIKEEISAETLDQVMLAWLKKHPIKIVPILGTMKANRVESALKAQNLELSNEQWYRLFAMSQLERLP